MTDNGPEVEHPLLVIIPALNEEASVGKVVRRASEVLRADVLVIDDGSRDDTAREAAAAGALVLRHPFNIGVGGAIRTGLRFAAERGYERVVQVDGDGQHPPEEAVRLLARLDEGYDLVVGSRFASGYKVSGMRRLAMRLLSRMVTRRVGVPIEDTTSGFRAFGRHAIESLSLDYPTAYLSDTVEALLLAADRGLRVSEVDVSMRLREAGVPSSRRLRSLMYLGRVVLVVLLHRVRKPGAQA
jgi:glycosyltransferase involved in cell wall biosynthesis